MKKGLFTFFTDKVIWYPYHFHQISIQWPRKPLGRFQRGRKSLFLWYWKFLKRGFAWNRKYFQYRLETYPTPFLTSRGSIWYPICVPVPHKYLKHSGINFRYDLLVCATTWPRHYHITTIRLRIWCALNCSVQYTVYRIFSHFFRQNTLFAIHHLGKNS